MVALLDSVKGLFSKAGQESRKAEEIAGALLARLRGKAESPEDDSPAFKNAQPLAVEAVQDASNSSSAEVRAQTAALAAARQVTSQRAGSANSAARGGSYWRDTVGAGRGAAVASPQGEPTGEATR